MPVYRISSTTLDSNIIVPSLVPATGKGEYTFRLADISDLPDADPEWISQGRFEDGSTWFLLGRLGNDRLVLKFPDAAEFTVEADRRTIRCRRYAGTPRSSVCKLLLDSVMPLALSRDSAAVLHASAVLCNGEAIVFAGASGRGKSTCAAYLAHCGWPVLADDFVVLNAAPCLVAHPSYPEIRLWSDAMTAMYGENVGVEMTARPGKRTIGDNGIAFHHLPARVRRIYQLGAHRPTSAGITIKRMSARDAVLCLLNVSYRIDLGNPASRTAEFDRLTSLAGHPIYRTLEGHGPFPLLPALHDAILDDLGTEGA